MTTTYILALVIGAVLCAGLFGWKLHRGNLKPETALIALPLSLLGGVVMARLSYFLLELRDMYVEYDGLGGLLSTSPDEFCFLGGCAGVVLAILLTAKITGQKALPVLDAFAPCGALMAAIARASVGLLDPMTMIGLGAWVENPAHQFFPVAVEIEWIGIFYAIFMLEAMLCLLCAAVSFLISHRGGFKPGRVFLHTAFFLALPQVFTEQILGKFMAWGFVRIEQLLCALIVFAITLYPCILRRRPAAFLPAAGSLVCAAVLIWMEFTLDNKLLFGIDIPSAGCYAIMIAALGCMAGLSLWAYHKLNKAELS
ncbi:MAG: prolipoprotein diacylglyceryl transferase [Clostridia bacterium]|nr:prolipoprotein diacylglyceryl transferase [Clostridia bacterium]